MNYAPLSDEDWPPDLAAMQGTFATRLHIYRVMAHHPSLLLAWRNLRDHVVSNNALDDSDLEIIILRTGHRRRSAYEWAHHVVRARAAGLSDDRIAATSKVVADPATQDALLITAADELIDHGRLAAATLVELTRRVGKQGVLDIMATVGMYTTLAFMANSFETAVDPDVAQSLSEAPLLGTTPFVRPEVTSGED